MWHALDRREMCAGFWWEVRRGHYEERGLDGRMKSEWFLGRLAGYVWNEFSWLRIDTGDRLLWTRWWTLGFCNHGFILAAVSFSPYVTFWCRCRLVDCLLWCGQTAVLQLRPWAYCSIPGWERCGPGRRDRLGLTPNLTTRVLWLSPETVLEIVGDGRREREFSLVLLHSVKWCQCSWVPCGKCHSTNCICLSCHKQVQ
jgi:hypothetical protein